MSGDGTDEKSSRGSDRAPRCRRCDSTLVPIVYGLVDSTAGDAADRGEMVLGGCLVGEDQPEWTCGKCRDLDPGVVQDLSGNLDPYVWVDTSVPVSVHVDFAYAEGYEDPDGAALPGECSDILESESQINDVGRRLYQRGLEGAPEYWDQYPEDVELEWVRLVLTLGSQLWQRSWWLSLDEFGERTEVLLAEFLDIARRLESLGEPTPDEPQPLVAPDKESTWPTPTTPGPRHTHRRIVVEVDDALTDQAATRLANRVWETCEFEVDSFTVKTNWAADGWT